MGVGKLRSARHGVARELVGAFVFDVAGMAFYPDPFDLVIFEGGF